MSLHQAGREAETGNRDVFPSCFRASQLISSARRAGERFGISLGCRFATRCACCLRGKLMGGGRSLSSTFSGNPCPCKYTSFVTENLCYLLHMYKYNGNQLIQSLDSLNTLRWVSGPWASGLCRKDVSVPVQFMETWSAEPVEPRERFIPSQSRHWHLSRWVAPYTPCLGTLLVFKTGAKTSSSSTDGNLVVTRNHELYHTSSLTQSLRKSMKKFTFLLVSMGLEQEY